MFAIKQFQKEDGFGLLNTLMVVVALGLMGGTLVILLISDLRMQVLNVERSRAFYAANSGIEYAIRGISEFAGHSQHLGNLNHYKETLDTGNGTRCEIAYHLIGKDSLEITTDTVAINCDENIFDKAETIKIGLLLPFDLDIKTLNLKFLK